MEVRFLASEETQAALIDLVEGCDSMQWAVAWSDLHCLVLSLVASQQSAFMFLVGFIDR